MGMYPMAKNIIQSIVLMVMAAMTLSCSGEQVAEKVERVTAVECMIVGQSDETITRTFTGSLQGEQQAVIYAKIAEAVEKVNVKEGESVKAGQVLLTLDKFGPSSQYQQAYSLYQNAEKNFKKMEYLYGEGAISESQYDASQTEYTVSRASFEAARRLVEIESPIDGIVTSLKVSNGDYLNPGQQLATVASTAKLRIKFGVNVADARYLSEGSAVTIVADAAETNGAGKVVSVARSADPATRTVQIEVIIDNADGRFKPGMFARIIIVLDEVKSVVVIPRSAVMELSEQATVFTVVNGLAVQQALALGLEMDGRVVIQSGLAPGDTLITLGQDYLEDGSRVNITAWRKTDR